MGVREKPPGGEFTANGHTRCHKSILIIVILLAVVVAAFVFSVAMPIVRCRARPRPQRFSNLSLILDADPSDSLIYH